MYNVMGALYGCRAISYTPVVIRSYCDGNHTASLSIVSCSAAFSLIITSNSFYLMTFRHGYEVRSLCSLM